MDTNKTGNTPKSNTSNSNLFKLELTKYQSIFYYEWKLNPLRYDYNVILDNTFYGEISVDRLNNGLIRLVNDYLLINSNVFMENDKLYWKQRDKIKESSSLLIYYDKPLSTEDLFSLATQPIDLEKDLLVKYYLIKLDEQKYRFITINSHLIVDGPSADSLLSEINNYHNDISYRCSLSINEQIDLHHKLSNKLNEIYDENRYKFNDFWSNHLVNASGIDLSFLKKNHNLNDVTNSNPISEIRFSFDADQLKMIKSITRKHKITPYIFGQLVFGILLHKFTGKENICFSFPVTILEGKNLIYGAHVNTVILNLFIDENTTIINLINNILSFYNNLKSSKAKYMPVNEIIKLIDNPNILEISYLQAYLGISTIEFDGINQVEINRDLEADINSPISFAQEEKVNQLNFRVRYNKNVLDGDLVVNFLNYYEQLFLEIITDLGANLHEKEVKNYHLLSQSQFHRIIENWNQTERDYSTDRTIQQWFEQQVEKTPDNIAITFEDIRLTYRQLNDKANQMAAYLIQNYQIKPDDLIALCLDRSEYMMIAVLAVIKAGAAYVPMDTGYPEERIKYIVTDTKTKVLLTNQCHCEKLNKVVNHIAAIEAIDSDIFLLKTIASYSKSNITTQTKSNNLAYVIYTSGTTGQPKGVMVEHRNVVNLFEATSELYHFDSNDVWTLFHAYTFDFSVWEIWGAFLYGGKLVIPTFEQTRDTNLFYKLCLKEGITILNQTPNAFYQFIDVTANHEEKINTLRFIIFGGEALNLEQLKPWFQTFSDTHPFLINMYGITETTVHVTYKKLIKSDLDSGSLIGKPIPSYKSYVLDNNMKPLPIGAIGELYIGGDGLTRGYLNNDELTAARFPKNPFQTEKEKQININSRLYKSGDLARILPDGELEYIGRNDFQVKIRGFRIELGEIEARMAAFNDIKQAVVLAKSQSTGTSKFLVGYYVADHEIETSQLITFLEEQLPNYMVPSTYVHLDELPLTINGKLDRKALPDPVIHNNQTFIAPANETEQTLCQVFADVLGLDPAEISVEDDFFRLGGDSILSIKLANKISLALNLEINVAAIFSYKSIRKIFENCLNKENHTPKILPVQVTDPEQQLLSFAQERLWFIEFYEGGSNAYNVPMIFKIKQEVNIESIIAAIKEIVNRHHILRSCILANKDGMGYQTFVDEAILPFNIQKVNLVSKEELDRTIEQEVNQVFNLNDNYPIQVKLFFMENDIYLSIVVHHIAFDGWSMDILLKEMLKLYQYYEALNTENEIPYPFNTPLFQYKDYALWQRNYLRGDVLQNQLDFWMTKLAGFENLNLPTDKQRPDKFDYKGDNILFEIDPETSAKLKIIARELNVSLYSLMLSGCYLMLSAYSNQNDIVIGSAIANRHYREIEDTIGFFVNTLALRQEIDPNKPVHELIGSVGQLVNEAQLNQDLPFEKLVQELGVEKDSSRHPVFQVMFVLQNFGEEQKEELGKLLEFISEDSIGYQVAKFDLSLFMKDNGEYIEGAINYASSLFDNETICSYIDTYKQVLKQFTKLNPNNKDKNLIRDIHYLNDQQENQLLFDWNQTEKEYPADRTIQQLFEEQVEYAPDNIAVVFEDIRLTYKQLNDRANQMAAYLIQNYQIKPDDLVALCLERSEHMMIAILAVLKAGAAYIPMDPGYPEDRIQYMLNDAKAKVLLTNEQHSEKLDKLVNHIVAIETIDSETFLANTIAEFPVVNNTTQTKADNLAYVIYTSGTTGKPKGVMVEHRGVVNLATEQARLFGLENPASNKQKNCLWFANYVFDAHVWELYTTITSGNTIYIVADKIRTDITLLKKYVLDNQIFLALIPPVLLDKDHILPLKNMVVGGDVSKQDIMDVYTEQGINVINAYGPTEYTVIATQHQYRKGDSNTNIGHPISNTSVYVLDAALNPIPVGATGELYIGGDGIARGYLNNNELTNERFIKNPFQTEEQKEQGRNKRIYKTGDLVKYLPNGNVQFIGRNDFQVKIRGFRIELGEIEARMTTCNGIKQAVVLAKKQPTGTSKYLVAYYVSDHEIETNLLTEFLQSQLPDYMVPSAFVHLEKLPMTINGKLDRKALPDPVIDSNRTVVPPANETERKLTQIFAGILGLDTTDISVNDDFFRLGGDSINSIQLVSRVKQQLNTQLTVKEIFTHKSVRAIYNHLISKDESKYVNMQTEQGVLHGEVTLLPIQEWFFANLDNNTFKDYNHWNQAFLIKVPELNEDILKQSIAKLIEYHDSFHLFYKKDTDRYIQEYNHASPDIKLNKYNVEGLSDSEIGTILTEWQNKFNIFDGNTFSVGYLTGYADNSARIHFALHHLIVDAVSWRIIKNDLQTIYNYLDEKAKIHADLSIIQPGDILGQKMTSYRQWSDAIVNYGKQASSQERAYWEKIIEGIPEANNRMESFTTNKVNYSNMTLDKELTNDLLRSSSHVFKTQINDILISALALAISELTQSSNCHILLEGHGREDISSDIDITNTAGWFTSMYPVAISIVPKSLHETLVAVKETLRKVPTNGLSYGALFGYIKNELPQIAFNYLGQFDSSNKGQEWAFSSENSGIQTSLKNQSNTKININGGVFNDQLQFFFAASITEDKLAMLTESFKASLEKYITFLTNAKRTYITPSDINYLISKKHMNSLQEHTQIEDIFKANSLQQGFIYHALNQGEVDDAYFVQLAWNYNTDINKDILKDAWAYTQKKYASLRMKFDWEEDLIQIIQKEGVLEWRYLDMTGKEEQETIIHELIAKDRKEPFDLSKGSLFRVYLIKRKENLYTSVFSCHHAIIDGWSNPILLKHLHESYFKLLNGESINHSPDTTYSNAQKYLQEHATDSLQFWDKYISLIESQEDLNALLKEEQKNINLSEYRHIKDEKETELRIKGNLYQQLKTVCSQNGFTLNTLMQYCWHKQLSIYGASNTTVVGMTVSGRNIPVDNIEQSVGLYINTLPVILEHKNGLITDSIKELQNHISDINTNCDVNLAKLQKGGERLFNSLFVFENYPMPEGDSKDDILGMELFTSKEKLDYPLGVIVYEYNQEVVYKIKYASELFEKDVIRQLLEGVELILKQLARNPLIRAEKLHYLNDQQENQLLFDWNQTEKEYPADRTIQQLFEEQVEYAPDNIAVVFEDIRLTYKQLNDRANQMAAYLIQNYQIKPDDLVALCLERSEHMMIAILAVLKAGAAYIPMDPGYPEDRIQYMLNDAKAKVLLTNEQHSEKLDKLVNHIVAIETIDSETFLANTIAEFPVVNNTTQTKADNLAYVIYTSGTTGKPKGVMVEHRGVVNLATEQARLFGLENPASNKQKNCLWFANYVFDAHVWELYTTITSGNTIYIVADKIRTDITLLKKYVLDNQIFLALIPPVLLDKDHILPLKNMVVGGDVSKQDIMDVYTEQGINVINAYGPTEYTVIATQHQYRKGDSNTNIGHPISNTSVYVLDAALNPIPVGATGELYIGGDGIARGYLNNNELTNERFIKNPFQTEEQKEQGRNKRIYKTGDLVKYLPNGNVQFIGRNDFQVKIRGFRIELGEIEARMTTCNGIKQAVVLAKKQPTGTSKYLVAYYVSDHEIETNLLTEFLQSQLPDYMVPSAFVHLEKLPMTINGKLDRKALPDPVIDSNRTVVPPANETERKLTQIFAGILGLDTTDISVNDDFFRLGGDSINSIQLVSRVKQQLNTQLTVKEIFTHKSVRAIYNHLISKDESKYVNMQTEQGVLHGEVTLLPIQEWFFANLDNNTFKDYNHWNQAFLIKVPELNEDILKQSIAKLIEYHDSFHLFYKKDTDRYIQEYNHASPDIKLNKYNVEGLSDSEIGTILTEWQNKFNIFDGNTFSVGYLTGYADNSARIHFALHHLIVDAVSWRIIKNDLQTIYNYLDEKAKIHADLSIIQPGDILGQKMTSYRQWSDAIVNYGKQASSQERAYWEKIIEGIPEANNRMESFTTNKVNYSNMTLDKELTNDLLRSSSHVFKTQINDILISALALAISELTQSSNCHILLEGHGREDISSDIDITNTAGWFTSMYPVAISIVPKSLHETLVAVKETLRKVPTNGLSYGALFGYIKNELPQIAFNYLGQFDSSNKGQEWAFSSENSGIQTSLKNQSNTKININGGVFNDQLQFFFAASITEDKLAMLTESFKASLEKYITFLTNAKRTYITPSDINYLISKKHMNSLQEHTQIEDIFKANSLQQGFIYHALNQGEVDDAYFVQLAWNYNTDINKDILKDAWAYTQKKYASLRMKFDWEEDLIQIIQKEGVLEWRYLDMTGKEEQETIIHELIAKDRKEPFDLSKGSLFRVYLIKRKENLYTSVFSCHHAIIDGWSNPILLKHLHESYFKLLNGESINHSPDTTYSNAQKYLQEHATDSLQFWDKYISLIESQEDLNALLKEEQKNINLSEYRHIKDEKETELRIKGNLYQQLKTVCSQNGFTLNTLMQYCWHKQLSIYGASNTTVVGMTVSGRNIPVDNIEQSVGLYINTLPVILEHKNGLITDSIKELQNHISDINTNCDVNLAKLQKGGERLFNSLFVFENYPMPEGDSKDDILGMELFTSKEKLDYPLGVIVYEYNQEVVYKIKYASELFEKDVIRQLLEGVELILKQLARNPLIRAEKLHYLNDQQENQLLFDWNQTEKEYPADRTIQQLFEEQVEYAPDNIAVVFEDIRLTYKQLNDRANQMAAYLIQNYQIKPDDLVALCLERSEHMMIAILAVLKAGAAYIPMDPGYPEDRIQYMLNDAKAKVLLTNEQHSEKLDKLVNHIVAIETIDSETFLANTIAEFPVVNNTTQTKADNLAYVIYTSGTTGKPKGVMVEHRGVVNLATEQARLFGLENPASNKQKNCLWFANYVFDAHVWELYTTITSGNTIYIVADKIRTDITLLKKYVLDNQIFLALIPPVLLDKDHILPLKNMVVGGDVSKQDIMDVYTEQGINVINAYGPTEYTVIATQHQYRKGDSNTNIGHPISNTSVYVLDAALNPIPVGATGELYIGGDGIARGYLNNNELTNERFIKNPFQTEEQKEQGRNKRIYKTGDLVKYLPNGNVQFIGRNDFQVKIRGFRIELGEIEARMTTCNGIKQAVVLAKKQPTGTSKYLVAYYVSDHEIETNLLTEFLQSQLPDYMVPSAFVHLEKLPMTINGKLDRRALPDPVINSNRTVVPPANETERKLAQIFAGILGLDTTDISVNDDFFRLGGDSILSIKLASRISQEFSKNMNVASIFSLKNVKSLAESLSTLDYIVPKIVSVNIQNPEQQLLSFAQERLWFIESYEGGSNAYNIPMIFKIKENTCTNSLLSAIKEIVNKNHVLRSLIRTNSEGTGYQSVINNSIYPLPIKHYELSSMQEFNQAISKASNYIFNLDNEYPIQIKLLNFDGVTYLSIVIHHIAFDGWSADIFIKELIVLYDYYEALKENKNVTYPLEIQSLQYKDYALWQRDYLSNEILQKQLDFWKSKLLGFETLNLPTDRKRPEKFNYLGYNLHFQLETEISSSLKKLAKDMNVSLYSLLLSGYYLLLSKYSNQRDIVVGSPFANRHYREIEDMIGFFVNTQALRMEIDPYVSVTDFITSVARLVNQVQVNQDLPFEKLVQELGVQKDPSRHPIFQVLFSLQNFGNEMQDKLNKIIEPFINEESVGYNNAKFDLSLFIQDKGEHIEGTLNYASSLFDKETIYSYIDAYKEILEQLIILNSVHKAPQINEIHYLNDLQKNRIVYEWNSTEIEYPDKNTIQSLFEEQVNKRPNNLALVYENIRLTYSELNNKANRLAAYLLDNYQIKPDDMIALCLDRSEHMIIAILAVLKAGGAYVPIDPAYPEERISFMLSDTDTKIILANKCYKDRLVEISEGEIDIFAIDSDNSAETLSSLPSTNPITKTNARNLAYVLYTSGTTGNPKGVMVEHFNVNKLVKNSKFVSIDESDHILSLASYLFDGSTYDFFMPLLNGIALTIANKEVLQDFDRLNKLIEDNGITNMFATTSLFHTLVDENLPCLKKLKYIVAGGEKISSNHVNKIINNNPSIKVVNGYGPTETTTFATTFQISRENNCIHVSIPIGRPLPNTMVYILDTNLNPVPVGAIGELYIGGDGVTRGYLNNPELTKEKFIKNPFQTEEQKRLGKNNRIYKTGDLVKYIPDSNIEYMGRNDFQIKMRGFRIELGEIESHLASFPGINQAVVLAKDHLSGNSKILIGYYVSESEVNDFELTKFLQLNLPDYMVPSAFIHLEKLPLTTNGKLDYRALPEPQFTHKETYIAPENKMQEEIRQIYGEVLGLDTSDISIDDDFFKIGGNSILLIKLGFRLNQHFNQKIKVDIFFKNSSIRMIEKEILKSKEFNPLVCFNNNNNDEKLFMLHPGGGDCHIYKNIANELSYKFDCYGIDNYNMYHSEHIENISKLTNYYLKHILTIQSINDDKPFNLLGWSLGGQIALEIAAILESKGVKNINIYLLDTVLRDDNDYVRSIFDSNEDRVNNLFTEKGLLELSKTEAKIAWQTISAKLKFSKIILFKAKKINSIFTPELQDYILRLKYNNIEKVICDKANLELIEMYSSTHHDIIEDEKFIKYMKN